MLKKYRKIKCETQYPHPVDSPDYLNPAGSIEDNHTNPYFIYELDMAFNGLPYRLMDIGCAGGQFAVDVHHKGAPWIGVGIEGGNILGMTKEFEERETHQGPLTKARGYENWTRYKDECLFHADVTKPFEIIDAETNENIRFDIITAYEFFEHPLPEEVPHIIENIKNHLVPGGGMFGTINLSPSEHHRCARPVEWWDAVFRDHGFTVHNYPFRTSPRTSLEFLFNLKRHLLNKTDGWLVDQEVAPVENPLNEGVYPACFVLESTS
jgi:SAM-dependent methyltransferase